MSTTPQGQLKQGTELYSDVAQAQNQAVNLNCSISIDLDIRVRSTYKIININKHEMYNIKKKNITNSYRKSKPHKLEVRDSIGRTETPRQSLNPNAKLAQDV